MYSVSDSYKRDINKTIRNPSHMRIRFNVVDPDAKNASTITDTSHLPFSDVSVLEDYVNVQTTYDTLEHNRILLDDNHIMPTESYGIYQGYVSSSMSDVNCVFQNPPSLVVNFTGYFEFIGLSLSFDSIANTFAKEFNVKLYDTNTLVHEFNVTNSMVNWVEQTQIPAHNKMVITFLKTNLPYSRVRVSQLGFGIIKIYEDDVITRTEQNKRTDLMSSVLPKNDFTFTFLDVENEYNPDNPSGIYPYIEGSQEVLVEYGYELDGGQTEWIRGCTNLTNGEMQTRSNGSINEVTIKTVNQLRELDDIYYRGLYSPSGNTFYNLALDVLSGTGLNYRIDISLQSLLTTAPLPVDTKAKCLQLIANATQCVLDIDRDGVINIRKPYSVELLLDSASSQLIDKFDSELYSQEGLMLSDFELSKMNSYSIPELSKYPVLKNMIVSYYNYIVSSTTTSLSEIEIVGASATQYYFSYELSTNHSITLSGTLSIVGSPIYYARGCYVTLSGTGKVIITGKEISTSKNTLVKQVNLTGVDCSIENELITNYSIATSYLNWSASIVNLQNMYTIENRGYPELDCTDNISIDTLGTTKVSTIVTDSKIIYDGGLRGTTKVLALK